MKDTSSRSAAEGRKKTVVGVERNWKKRHYVNNKWDFFPCYLIECFLSLSSRNISYNPIVELQADHFDKLHKLKSL